MTRAERLFTRSFFLIFLTTLVTFIGYYLLIPTLPVYVVQLGGREADVGIVYGAVTVAAVALRPIIGVQADRRGRRTILLVGLVGVLIAMALYPLATTIPSLIILRIFHGAAWAASTNSLMTLVADIAPPARRGEAMGFHGISYNFAMAIAPALGMTIINSSPFTFLFAACSGLALSAVLFGTAIPEPRRVQPSRLDSSTTKKASAFTFEALFPAIIVFFITISYGTLTSFLPLYAKGFGVDNPGLFFTIYAVVLLLSRPLTGRISDRYGRAAVIVPGTVSIIVAMVVLSLSGDMLTLALVGVLYGLGFSSVQPTLLALAVDRSAGASRGTSMANFLAAYDLGIGGGAMIMGFIIMYLGYSHMFLIAAFAALLALVVFVGRERKSIFKREPSF